MKKLLMLVVLLLMILTGCQEKKEVTLTSDELDAISFEFKSDSMDSFYIINNSDDLIISNVGVGVCITDVEDNLDDCHVDSEYYRFKENVVPNSEENLKFYTEPPFKIEVDKYFIEDYHYNVEKNNHNFFVRANGDGKITITDKEK